MKTLRGSVSSRLKERAKALAVRFPGLGEIPLEILIMVEAHTRALFRLEMLQAAHDRGARLPTDVAGRLVAQGAQQLLEQIAWDVWGMVAKFAFFNEPLTTAGIFSLSQDQAGAVSAAGASLVPANVHPGTFMTAWCNFWEQHLYCACARLNADYEALLDQRAGVTRIR